MSLLERWGLRHVESVDDYLSVLIPLDKAHLYSHSAKQGRAGSASRREDADVGDAEEEKDGENETSGMLHGHAGEYSIEGLRKEMRQGNQGKWTSNEIKSKLINKALQDIGMGTYNWQLFVLCGFGWFADNLWLQGASLTLPSLSAEFGVSEKTVRYTTSALFVGLALGSFSWGIGSDYVGRRVPFNVTLLIASVFGIATAYQQSWGGVCFFYAAMGFGVGGSLPVDGALFLEFLPDASSALLTVLSVWWPIGQLISSLIAWFFIAQWPAEQGWRYFLVTIGIMTFTMFAIRFFVFRLLESPKYLLSKGRQHEAVAVIHGVAYRNKTRTWLTSEIMDEVAAEDDSVMGYEEQEYKNSSSGNPLVQKIKGLYSSDKLKLLFKDKKLGLATGLMWFCWTAIGMGYPLFNAFLPQYFARYSGKGEGGSVHSETSPITGETYRNYAITSVFGVPGSLIAAYLVDHPSPFFGRRGTLASSTLISAVFLFFFVIWGNTSTKQLIFSCVGSFSQNIMYGVLYAFTPEIFPTPVRGAGSGVASFLNRVAGLFAPVIAANAPGDGADMPIYLSAILILMAFVSICCIPIETRGAQRL